MASLLSVRVVMRRHTELLMAAGLMIATIGGLPLSVNFGLFGFMATLAGPYAGLSLGVEVAGAVLFVGMVLVRGHRLSDPGHPPIDLEGPLCHLTSGALQLGSRHWTAQSVSIGCVDR